jgi:hypothetical protein
MIFALVGGADAVVNGVLTLAGTSADQLTTPADVVLTCGVLLMLFAVLMYQSAAVWARVLVTLAAVLAVAFSAVLIANVTDPLTAILSVVTIIGGVVAVVMIWLPAKRPSA